MARTAAQEALKRRCLDGVKRFDAAEARFKAILSRMATDPSFHQDQAAELLDEMAAGVEMIREGLPITKELVSCTVHRLYLAPCVHGGASVVHTHCT
jgi:hypothetical protein